MATTIIPSGVVILLYRFKNKEWREWWFRQGSLKEKQYTAAVTPVVSVCWDPVKDAERVAAKFRQNGWTATVVRFMTDEEAKAAGVQ